MQNRQEKIKREKLLTSFNTNYKEDTPISRNLEFQKAKLGKQVLEDLIAELGSYKKTNSSYADKQFVLDAINAYDFNTMREISPPNNLGNIYDTNGIVLAGNITTTSLVLIPNQIKDKEYCTSELSKILNVSYDEMKKHVYKKTSIERVHPEGRKLDFETANTISDLKLEGVLLTMFDSKTNLSIEVIEEIRSYFKEKVYTTIIPRLIRLADAPSHGKPIIAYDPKSKGSLAYLNLAKEVIERNGNT